MSGIFAKILSSMGRISKGNTSTLLASKPVCFSSNVPRSFLCPETDPRKHTLKDVGLIYSISNSQGMNGLFRYSYLYPKYMEECATFGKTYFLIRRPAVEIINSLNHTDFSNPVNRYVLYGKRGHGVSTTILHLVHYAHASEWLIIHVPSVVPWLTAKTERVKSAMDPELLDLPIIGSNWLSHFKIQNLNTIQKLDLRIQNNYTWNIQEENKKGDSLLNFIDHGISRGKYSCDVIMGLLDEVKMFCKSGTVKCLVAIDNYSVLFHPGRKSTNRKIKNLSPMQISFVESFKNMARADWHNGAVVLSCLSEKNIQSDLDHFPLNKLSIQGFEFLEPFVPIEVPKLTELEMITLLDFYRSENWLLMSGADNELMALSGGSIQTLRNLCGPL